MDAKSSILHCSTVMLKWWSYLLRACTHGQKCSKNGYWPCTFLQGVSI